MLGKNDQMQLLKNLKIATDILTKHDIIYWLDAGTILCAYRDGDLAHEHDTDIGIFVEDFHKLEALRDEFNKVFDDSIGLWKFNGSNPIYFSWGTGSKTVLHGDIVVWYPTENYRTCWGKIPFSVPKDWLNSFCYMNFWNLDPDLYFLVPSKYLQYIEHLWGKKEWETKIGNIELQVFLSKVKDGQEEPYPVNKPIKEVMDYRHKIQHEKLSFSKIRPEITINKRYIP